MIVLVFGPNDSGKSRFAERLVEGTHGPRYYIATMVPQSEEDRQRIEKHRRQRAGLGFHTLELPCDMALAPVAADGVVLLEDVSNLLANVMFQRGGGGEQVYRDLLDLARRCRILVLVTISGLRAGDYRGETVDYVASLEELNRRLLDKADTAVEMRGGAPVCRKGEYHGIA